MDTKSNLINQITAAMQPMLKTETLQMLENVLILKLQDYDIAPRCTELAPTGDESPFLALQRYIDTKRVEGKSEKTLARYHYEDCRMLLDIGKPLKQITTFDIRCHLANYKRQRNVSNRTLNGLRRCYNGFFQWAVAEGIIDRNPCAAIAPIKFTKIVKKPFSHPEMERLRTSCKTIRDRSLVEFLYATGCRVSEVVRLNREDINIRTGELTILGKGNKERTVYLSDVACMYLQDYMQSRKDDNPALFVWDKAPYNRLSKNGIEALMRRLGIVAGVANTHPHRYRRTLATNLLDRGANIQDVAAILGHEDLKTTQIYCTISQKNVRASYQKYAS